METAINSELRDKTSEPGSGDALSFTTLLASIFAAIVYFFIPQSMPDPDIWWHLRNAEYQIATRSFITKDMYSFTALGAPWMDHEWLAELPYYLGWHLLGARGLYLVAVCAIEVILLGIFWLAYRKSGNIKASLLVSIIAAVLSTVSFGPRTLLFGWICMIGELLILDSFLHDDDLASHHRQLWLLPPLFLIWVNTHGSWLIGLVLLIVFLTAGMFNIKLGAVEGIRWSGAQRRSLVTAACLSMGALFINPYGWRLVAYPFNLAFHQKLNVSNLEEWRTLDFHSGRGILLLLALALLFLVQILCRRKWMPYELAFLFIAVYASFTYSRFLFLAAILVMPILANHLSELLPCRVAKNRPWLNGIMIAALLPLMALRFPEEQQILASGGKKFPDQALAYLKDFHPQGNVYNDFLWGGYLVWHERQIPVFIDSRVDIFEYSGVFKDYLDARGLKNTFAVLDKYNIRYVLYQKDAPLVYLLEHTASWKVDYEDQTTVLLERNNAKP